MSRELSGEKGSRGEVTLTYSVPPHRICFPPAAISICICQPELSPPTTLISANSAAAQSFSIGLRKLTALRVCPLQHPPAPAQDPRTLIFSCLVKPTSSVSIKRSHPCVQLICHHGPSRGFPGAAQCVSAGQELYSRVCMLTCAFCLCFSLHRIGPLCMRAFVCACPS